MAKSKALIKERDGIRGMVPSREFGIQDRVYKSYLDTLNPRESHDVQLALAASSDNRFTEFLERIKLRKYKRISLPSIAKACNISLLEFQQWWQKESTQAAIAVAQTESVNITKDMVSDARSKDTACERCDGLTWISSPAGLPEETPGYRSVTDALGTVMWIRNCPNCNAGRVTKPGDQHARDRVLELAGLVKKGPGLVINQSFAGNHASSVSALDDVMTIDID